MSTVTPPKKQTMDKNKPKEIYCIVLSYRYNNTQLSSEIFLFISQIIQADEEVREADKEESLFSYHKAYMSNMKHWILRIISKFLVMMRFYITMGRPLVYRLLSMLAVLIISLRCS